MEGEDFPPKHEFLIERVSRTLKFEDFGRSLTGKRNLGTYFFLWTTLAANLFGLSLITYLQYGWNPLTKDAIVRILIVVFITAVIWGRNSLEDKYIEIVGTSDVMKGSELRSKKIISNETEYAILSVLALLALTYIAFDASEILRNPFLLGYPSTRSVLCQGVIAGSIRYLIWILVYVPILTGFFATFIGINVRFPLGIRNTDLNLDFSDHWRRGGMKPIGELMLHSSQVYFLVLTVGTFIPIIITLQGIPAQVGVGTITVTSGAWVLGLLFFFVPQIVIKNRVRKEKEKKIKELRELMEAEGKTPDGFIDAEPTDTEEAIKYIHRYVQFDHAHKMKEYPFDIGTFTDMIKVGLIPLVIQLFTIFFL